MDLTSLKMQGFLSRSRNIYEVIERMKKMVMRELKKAYPDVDYLDDTDLIESVQDIYMQRGCSFISC